MIGFEISLLAESYPHYWDGLHLIKLLVSNRTRKDVPFSSDYSILRFLLHEDQQDFLPVRVQCQFRECLRCYWLDNSVQIYEDSISGIPIPVSETSNSVYSMSFVVTERKYKCIWPFFVYLNALDNRLSSIVVIASLSNTRGFCLFQLQFQRWCLYSCLILWI